MENPEKLLKALQKQNRTLHRTVNNLNQLIDIKNEHIEYYKNLPNVEIESLKIQLQTSKEVVNI